MVIVLPMQGRARDLADVRIRSILSHGRTVREEGPFRVNWHWTEAPYYGRLPFPGSTGRTIAADRTMPGIAGIEKTEGVCDGSARIVGTRIPIWLLVEARDLGASEDQLLLDYPGLRAEDLVNAWSYARAHRDEIEAEIRENEVD
jgi:uncharacterized protein (DUF433 family)